MATEKLCTGSVENIAALIKKCQFPHDVLFLGEELPDHVVAPKERQALLLFTRFDDRLPFAKYTSGRIFHQDFELRWAKKQGTTHVLYLGTAQQVLPAELIEQNVKLPACQTHYYYLFGTRLRPEQLEQIGVSAHERDIAFAGVRIPRLLLYPLKDGSPVPKEKRQRVRLAVCEYRSETTGSVEFFRFQGLETMELNV
jgi:hypothetical protein